MKEGKHLSSKKDINPTDLIHAESSDLLAMLQGSHDQNISSFLGTLTMLVGKESLDDTVKWMVGEETKAPASVRFMTSNVTEKISLLSILLMMQNLQRSSSIISYLKDAEEALFNREVLPQMDSSEILKVYSTAQKSLSSILDYTHKFTQQNKDALEESSEINAMVELLMSLSPKEAEKLKDLLKDPSFRSS